MNNDVLLIVLTEDRWLYAGLAALMPEMVCRLSGFLAHRQPRVVRVARHIIIVVDSRILFRGEWSGIQAQQAGCPRHRPGTDADGASSSAAFFIRGQCAAAVETDGKAATDAVLTPA
ncbi:hypothetical protein [Symbiopectobacterium purcellii]|uniref:Uncharacterized protein n=1 Tax=Symbiopectobacterium purcellii TaxID=2871826 RepID=A0ABX9APK5_9ENTR|nr:hypothetical protein [Symbiopectobacterium purcellii]QZN95424.1 hypothetical protein K6K13_19930 [Symbiopectobacterium purcellii]